MGHGAPLPFISFLDFCTQHLQILNSTENYGRVAVYVDTGGTWKRRARWHSPFDTGAYTQTFTAAPSLGLKLFEDSSGNIRAIYVSGTSLIMKTIYPTSGGQPETTIGTVAVNSKVVGIVKLPSDEYMVIISSGTSGMKYRIANSDLSSWGSETSITATQAATAGGVCMVNDNEDILVTFPAYGASPYLREIINDSGIGDIPFGYIATELGAGIIECGENSNGNYIKFSDGTMICWGALDAAVVATFAAGSYWWAAYQTWTFPAEYSDSPKVFALADNYGRPARGIVTTTTAAIKVTRNDSGASAGARYLQSGGGNENQIQPDKVK
jgi:hypothetical protein